MHLLCALSKSLLLWQRGEGEVLGRWGHLRSGDLRRSFVQCYLLATVCILHMWFSLKGNSNAVP